MYLCFCWCFVPLWAHSIPTSTVACSRRLGCCPGVLPRPCVRAAAAFASRSGLAGGRVLGEWRTHHCVVEIKSLFLDMPSPKPEDFSSARHRMRAATLPCRDSTLRKVKPLHKRSRLHQTIPKRTYVPRAYSRENARQNSTCPYSRMPIAYALSAANAAPPTALVKKFERLSEPLTSLTVMRFSSM